jgi:hypothetical protein
MQWRERRGAVLGFAAVVAWFLALAGEGVGAWFTPDDLMNLRALHGLWDRPGWSIVLGLFNPFSADYRPLGGIFYRLFWELFGLNPLPYRLFCHALLITCLMLVYLLLRRYVDSIPAAVAGILACAYWPEMVDLYFNSGAIYDLLAANFFLLALWRAPTAPWWEISVYTWLALQSKEMAATLPAALAGLYWLLERRIRWAPLISCSLVTAVVLLPKLLAGRGLISNDLYRPRLDLQFILEQYAKYHHDFLNLDTSMQTGWMVFMWFVVLLLATTLRDRRMIYGGLFWLITLIPVAVIPARSAFVLLLPLTGLGLYFGALLSRCGSLRWQYGILFALALPLTVWHWQGRLSRHEAMWRQSETLRGLSLQLRHQSPPSSPGAHFHFSRDPFAPGDWTLSFLVQLTYRDPSIVVERAKDRPPYLAQTVPEGCDRMLDFANGHLTSRACEDVLPADAVTVEFSPEVVHHGQTYRVSIPGWSNVHVDVRYLLADQRPPAAGQVENWCHLDSRGQATLHVPESLSPGRIRILKVRKPGEEWRPARGVLRLIP